MGRRWGSRHALATYRHADACHAAVERELLGVEVGKTVEGAHHVLFTTLVAVRGVPHGKPAPRVPKLLPPPECEGFQILGHTRLLPEGAVVVASDDWGVCNVAWLVSHSPPRAWECPPGRGL